MWLTFVLSGLALVLLAHYLRTRDNSRAPGSPTNLTLESDEMSNLRVRWVLPAVAADQRPLSVTSVEMRSDPSFPFAEVARVSAAANSPNPTDTVLLPNLADGTYDVRVRCIDADGRNGSYSSVASIQLIAVVTRAPDAPTGLALSQE